MKPDAYKVVVVAGDPENNVKDFQNKVNAAMQIPEYQSYSIVSMTAIAKGIFVLLLAHK